MNITNMDPNLAAQAAFWNAASEYQQDLRETAMELQENNQLKAALRELDDEVKALEDAMANYNAEGGDTQENRDAMNAALSNLRNEMRELGFDNDSAMLQATIAGDAELGEDGLKEIGTGTWGAILDDPEGFISNITDAIQNQKDNASDIGDWVQLKLQAAQNGYNRTSDTIANIMKANDTAARTAINNLK
jgi:hypothetical protein